MNFGKNIGNIVSKYNPHLILGGATLYYLWTKIYSEENPKLQNNLTKLTCNDIDERMKAINELVTYSHQGKASQEEMYAHYSTHYIMKCAKNLEIKKENAEIINKLLTILTNTLKGDKARNEFCKYGGDKFLLKLLTSEVKEIKLNTLKAIAKATLFLSSRRILPDDIPFGSTAGLAFLSLSEEEMKQFLEILNSSNNSEKIYCLQVLSNITYIHPLAKVISRNKVDVVASLINELIKAAGRDFMEFRKLTLITLANIAEADFHEELLYNNTTVQKVFDLVIEESSQLHVVRYITAILSGLLKTKDSIEKRDAIGKIFCNPVRVRFFVAMLSLIDNKNTRKRKATGKLIKLLRTPDLFSEKYEKVIHSLIDEQLERSERRRKEEFERRKEMQQQQMFQQMMGGF